MERLLLDGTRVVGVRLAGSCEVRVRRSVVLTAGTLRSPQLLMLSGIGPAAHLRQHGIEVVHDLPGVGENLQDHPLVAGVWPVTDGSAVPDHSSAAAAREYELLGRGPLASFMQVVALHRLDAEAPAPDMQFNFVTFRGEAGPVVAPAPILLTPGMWSDTGMTVRGDTENDSALCHPPASAGAQREPRAPRLLATRPPQGPGKVVR